ncbi:hypothetical protein REPUB_Repub02eG0066000 [Reevesia pubescens]
MVQKARVIPCETFCGRKYYCKPGFTTRIQRKFRDLLYDVQKEGIPLKGMFSLKKLPVHSSLDFERYSKVLDYLGVASDSESNECILYAEADDDHAWLIKWNKKFGVQDDMFFLPCSTRKAIISHVNSAFICSWLLSNAGLSCYTVYAYAREVCEVLDSKDEPKLAIDCAHFVYHSYSKGFISEPELHFLCRIMPIVDGSGCPRKKRAVTLVPASHSKWATLFGPINPFLDQNYIDIGEANAESYQFVGEHTPEKELLDFLVKHFGAKDLPKLWPPDMVLPLTSCLTSELAFLLLDWISFPKQSVLLDITGKIVFEMMKNVLDDFFVLDQKFYTNRLCSYADELKCLGVRFGFDDLQRLLANRFKSLTSYSLSKEQTYSLLMFISISREKNMFDPEWLDAMKKGKWLQTSQGYSAPKESLFLQLETEAEAVLKITNLPVVDESFYGSKLSSFSSELITLGVILDMESAYDLIVQNLTFPADVASITSNCGLLVLRCIRYRGSAASGFIESVIQQPWLKTISGVECPLKCILFNVEWDSLYKIVDVPIIDEGFYGSEIRSFMAELKTVGVAVDFDGAFLLIIAQFKLLSSSYSLTPANVISMLICIKEMIQKRPSQVLEFPSSLLGERWFKTRHGYRAPNESILFSSKWGTISLFIDLPFIDDSFYSIGIYGYRDELKILGVVIDFTEGAFFVAKGLKQPIDVGLITRDSAISLLECIECLMSECNDQQVGTVYYRLPSIDERDYDSDFSLYENQLRVIGVKVDPGDVCSLLFELLLSNTETSCITRMYSFLCRFHLNQESPNESDSQVWIPNQNGAGEGKWISSHLCVLYDKYQIFGSRLYALEDYYGKELFPMFTSIFGVAKFPSINDYLQLWNGWVLRSNSQVTAVECFSFFAFVIDNWNPLTLETLKENLTKLPATTFTSDEIYLVSREEVFLPDDLQLKRIFENVGVPLFTWLPRHNSLSPVLPWRLYQVYHSIGVRKISESVDCKVDRILLLNFQSKKFVDSRNGLFEKGLLKIILAFLSGPMMNMPAKERHKAAKSLLDLSVFETDKSIQVNYRFLLCRRSRTLESSRKKMVLWDRNSHRLLLDGSGFEDRKTNIEFVSAFAQEIAEGLLSLGKADAIGSLSKLVQIGFMFDYKEDAVDFLLIKENLELFVEDAEFLNDAFGKRTHPRSDQLGPLTPIPSSKKRCQCSVSPLLLFGMITCVIRS